MKLSRLISLLEYAAQEMATQYGLRDPDVMIQVGDDILEHPLGLKIGPEFTANRDQQNLVLLEATDLSILPSFEVWIDARRQEEIIREAQEEATKTEATQPICSCCVEPPRGSLERP